MNVTFHRAIKCSPYEAVFGFKAHREVAATAIPANEEEFSQEIAENVKEIPDTINLEQQAKRQKICENQQHYNAKMNKQAQQSKKMSFKVDDLVAIKIHKPDKVSNLHANMLIAKILEIDSTTNYVKAVTQYGIIKGQIASSRLNPCTATKVTFN